MHISMPSTGGLYRQSDNSDPIFADVRRGPWWGRVWPHWTQMPSCCLCWTRWSCRTVWRTSCSLQGWPAGSARWRRSVRYIRTGTRRTPSRRWCGWWSSCWAGSRRRRRGTASSSPGSRRPKLDWEGDVSRRTRTVRTFSSDRAWYSRHSK